MDNIKLKTRDSEKTKDKAACNNVDCSVKLEKKTLSGGRQNER